MVISNFSGKKKSASGTVCLFVTIVIVKSSTAQTNKNHWNSDNLVDILIVGFAFPVITARLKCSICSSMRWV